MTKSGTPAAALLLLLATTATAEEQGKPSGNDTANAPEIVAPFDLRWTDTPMKGIQAAPLWGNPANSPHGRFLRFAAGTDNPPHTHSRRLRTVVVSGTFYLGADAATAKNVGPGSYATIPAGWKHVSGCRLGDDCVLYEESTGRFDFKPVSRAEPAEAK